MLARGVCVLREMCGERLLAKESVGARGCWRKRVLAREERVARKIVGERGESGERLSAKESVGERLYMPGEGCVMGESVEWNLIDGMAVCSRGE